MYGRAGSGPTAHSAPPRAQTQSVSLTVPLSSSLNGGRSYRVFVLAAKTNSSLANFSDAETGLPAVVQPWSFRVRGASEPVALLEVCPAASAPERGTSRTWMPARSC
jgi:hypothetical protein